MPSNPTYPGPFRRTWEEREPFGQAQRASRGRRARRASAPTALASGRRRVGTGLLPSARGSSSSSAPSRACRSGRPRSYPCSRASSSRVLPLIRPGFALRPSRIGRRRARSRPRRRPPRRYRARRSRHPPAPLDAAPPAGAPRRRTAAGSPGLRRTRAGAGDRLRFPRNPSGRPTSRCSTRTIWRRAKRPSLRVTTCLTRTRPTRTSRTATCLTRTCPTRSLRPLVTRLLAGTRFLKVQPTVAGSASSKPARPQTPGTARRRARSRSFSQ